MVENVRENKFFMLYNNDTKSEAYFRQARWQGEGIVQINTKERFIT